MPNGTHKDRQNTSKWAASTLGTAYYGIRLFYPKIRHRSVSLLTFLFSTFVMPVQQCNVPYGSCGIYSNQSWVTREFTNKTGLRKTALPASPFLCFCSASFCRLLFYRGLSPIVPRGLSPIVPIVVCPRLFRLLRPKRFQLQFFYHFEMLYIA